MSHQLVENNGSPPTNAVSMGHQNDSGDLYVAVANTDWGSIPGKAQGNTCWYPYGGKEQSTSKFKWLVAPHYALTLELNRGQGPPAKSLGLGHQTDGGGIQYCAVANTQWGRIPGKASGKDCWYSYGGKEHATQSFDWLVVRPSA